MGKKSRRKPAKPPRAPNTPDTAAGDDDWPSPPGADDQNWWTDGAAAGADFVARTYEEIVSDPNHNDYPLAERHAAAGLAPLKRRPERVKKRRPSCDVCGAENARYTCVGCGSQNYCGKDCQKYAWREDGHRDECKTLQDKSRAEAAALVAQLNDESLIPPLRVRDLERLDGDDVYMPAVEFGLYAAFRSVLRAQTDFLSLLELYTSSDYECSFLQFLACTPFRGERRSRAGTGSFSKADGQRFAEFVDSSDDTWELWLAATATLVRVCTDRRLQLQTHTHTVCHRTCRDALCGLVLVLARREVAEALCASRDGSDADKAFIKARALRSAKLLKKMLDHLAATSEDEDPGSILEGNVNQITAQFAHWCQVHRVGVDVERIVGLRGARKQMYEGLAVPLARATIDKGRILNSSESRAVMTAIRRNF